MTFFAAPRYGPVPNGGKVDPADTENAMSRLIQSLDYTRTWQNSGADQT